MAYIGNFPTDPGFRAARFRQQTLTKKTETASGRTIRATNSTTLWKGILTFPPMDLTEFKPVQAFVARCQGPLNEFDVVIPTISQTTGGYANQVTIANSDAGAGASSIDCYATNGGSPIASDVVLKAGDVIRFYNHTKVYMVTEDVTTNGSGIATINFQPNLVTAVQGNDSGGQLITVNNVPFRMILTNDIQEFAYRNDGLVEYEIDVQEVL